MATRNTSLRNRRQIVIFVGTNGAGKTSTYYQGKKLIRALSKIPYINPDEIAAKYGLDPLPAVRRAIEFFKGYVVSVEA